MNDIQKPARKSWVRRHKWLVALAVVAVLLFAAVQAVEYFIHVDRYREQLVQFVADKTDMPVSVDRLELMLFPQPTLAAYNVSIGEGELRVQCSEARATASWSGLASRQVNVTDVTFYGLAAALPEEVARIRERVELIQKNLMADPDAPSKWRITIARIRARSARISVTGIERPVFEGDIDAQDVLTDSIPMSAAGALPFLGDPARAEAEVVLAVHKGAQPPVVPSGWLEVRGFDPREALEREALPPLVFEVRATVAEVTAESIGLDLHGKAEAARGAPDLVRAAAGPFDGMLWIRGSEFIVNDLSLKAPSLTAMADATRAPDGAVACEIQSVKIEGDALAAVYAMVNTEGLELVPQKDAAITASDMLVGIDAEGALRLVKGEIAFAGVQPTLSDGSRPFGDIQGRVHLDEGVVHIDEMTGSGIAVRGTVKPDLARSGASIDLAADLTLSPGVVTAFVKNDALKGLSGRVAFTRIAGTFEKGKTLPDDLKIDGTIDKVQAGVALGGLEERLSAVSGRFAAEPGAVRVNASGQSALMGPVSADARISPEDQRITGVLKADLGNVNLPFPEDETSKSAVMNIARAYGPSAFDVDVTLPTAEASRGAVRITRQGTPELSAVVALARQNDATSAVSVDARAAVPLAAVRELVPEPVQVEGTAGVAATLTLDNKPFETHIDLAQAAVRVGEYVNKRAGDPATADVLVAQVNGAWKPQTLTLHYGGENIVARFEDGRIASDFDLEVAALQSLFAENMQANGRANGSVKTSPLDVDVQLEGCALALSDTLRFDALDGRVAYSNETPRVDDLAVRGLNSDFTVTMRATPEGVWQGAVRGNQLDVDALTAAVEGFKGKEDASSAAQDGAKTPPPGVDLDVQLARVLYRNAQVGDVRATVTGRDGVYDIQDLSLAPGSGSVTGTAQVRMAAGPGPSALAMDLALRDVDLAIVDGIAFATPRGLTGLTTGTLKLTAPVGGGVNPTNGATGTIQFVSRNGSLGRLGIATKILTVMRTTEIIRLRMPPTKDEGITFDTCEVKATLDTGFMTIDQFDLKSPTLAMAARGTIDFPRDVTDMLVDIHFLQVATQVLDIVNLGDVADQIRKQSSYRLAVSGSPTDPKVSVQGLTTGEGVTGTAKDAAKTGQQTVVDVLQESAGILRGILGGGGSDKQQQAPQEDPKPEQPAEPQNP